MSGFANLIKVTLILDILAQSTNIFLVSKNTKKRVVEFFFAKVIGFSPLLILLIAAFFLLLLQQIIKPGRKNFS